MSAGRARLDRLLANLGYGSRRQVQDMIRAGRVVLEGRPVTDPSAHVGFDAGLPSRMTLDGRPVDPPAPLTLIMHKPLGVVCSHREEGRSVYELLPARWRARVPALSTIGRLDRDTSGLLLITDDGDLLHRIISPRSKVAKGYLAELAAPLNGDEGELFASGTLVLPGETSPLAPATLEIIGSRKVMLTISEGRYHQVRRMFAATSNEVIVLHRSFIGGLTLPNNLDPGDYRILGNEERLSIFE